MWNCSTSQRYWARGPDQQNIGGDRKHLLMSMLRDGSAALRAFMGRHENNSDLDFVLTEAVILGV
jgi:hypothetical protein